MSTARSSASARSGDRGERLFRVASRVRADRRPRPEHAHQPGVLPADRDLPVQHGAQGGTPVPRRDLVEQHLAGHVIHHEVDQVLLALKERVEAHRPGEEFGGYPPYRNCF
ncbi:hypothetical protein [Actinoplanes palleronii]|uniref:hypothetical protein n=1 Tax=Actinoplanes palleronii TaxID=113570 RepID=UPI0019440FBC|nr:hypothetical protein [Actinoplanes palleronii]